MSTEIIIIGVVIVVIIFIAVSLSSTSSHHKKSKQDNDRHQSSNQGFDFNLDQIREIDPDELEISDDPPQRFGEEGPSSAHRTNGKMPQLLLAPLGFYGSIVFVLVIITFLTATLIAR